MYCLALTGPNEKKKRSCSEFKTKANIQGLCASFRGENIILMQFIVCLFGTDGTNQQGIKVSILVLIHTEHELACLLSGSLESFSLSKFLIYKNYENMSMKVIHTRSNMKSIIKSIKICVSSYLL